MLDSTLPQKAMILSVHDPLLRKRVLGDKNSKNKKPRVEPDQETADRMFTIVVKSAIDSLEKNDPTKVNALTAKINLPVARSDALSISHFTIVLKTLNASISKLESAAASGLIAAILRYRWLEIPSKFQKTPEFGAFTAAYAQFMNVLVSSYPRYLQDVIFKFVREFQDCSGDTYPHHLVIKRLVTYIPTSINAISQTLASCFPHYLSSTTFEMRRYIENCVRVMTYCPDLQYPVWQLVMQYCIRLDVELQNEIDDLDDDLIEELINEGEEEIEEEHEEEEDEGENGEEVVIEEPTQTEIIKKLVSKLDTSLELVLRFTEGKFTAMDLESGEGVSLYNTLTSLFKTHVLPTHFTKSVQFLLFHVSQYQPELADSFLVLLIDVAFSPAETTEKRLKALQYLASYISRAKNLTRHQVVFIVSYLIGWINKYIAEREREVFEMDSNSSVSSAGGMERFKLFYATFQALLYIFCFRHKQLTRPADEVAKGESEWECDIDRFFQRVIIARFNPLKFCDETVVYIFAKIATKLNVCYCYSLIEHNKRERMTQTNSNLPSSVGNFRHKQEFLDLEAYFPFDPMVLPHCKKIVGQNYVEWKDVNPADDDDDDEDTGSLGDDNDNESEEEDEDEDDFENEVDRVEDSDDITSDEEDD